MSEHVEDKKEPGLLWEISLAELRHDSERRAWRIAAAALVIASLSLTTLMLILPLKQAIPYLISVDRATGEHEIVALAAHQPVALRQIETKYWVETYVRARERIDRNSLQDDFSTVVHWSSNEAQTSYEATIRALLALEHSHKPAPETRIQILSIGLVDDAHAVVRFVRIPLASGSAPAAAASRGTASLSFSMKPMLIAKEGDMIENPMGFHVQSYRVDEDLIDVQGGNP